MAAKARLRKKRIGSIGAGARSSHATKAASSTAPAPIDASTVGLVQPSACERTIPNTIPSSPELASTTPRRSSVRFGPLLSASTASANGTSSDSHGHVQPEDPVPGEAVHDRAADHRAERDAEARHAGPDAERESALLGGEGVAQQRQRQGRDHGAAEALHGARGDQRLGARRERRRRRGDREDAHPRDEDGPATDPVAERRGGQEEDRVAERVGVDRPLELLEARAEILADAHQSIRHDEVVERDHEQRDRDDRQGPAALA